MKLKDRYKVDYHETAIYKDYEYHMFHCYNADGEQLKFILRGFNLPNLFGNDEPTLVNFIGEVVDMDWFYTDRLVNGNGIDINTYIEGFNLDLELYSANKI